MEKNEMIKIISNNRAALKRIRGVYFVDDIMRHLLEMNELITVEFALDYEKTYQHDPGLDIILADGLIVGYGS